MTHFQTSEEIIEYAMGEEQKAADLYTDIAEKTKSAAMKKVFLEYADEEKMHKKKLAEIKAGGKMTPADIQVQNLKIADYSVDVELGENPSYQDVLLFAMKQEKNAFKLYTDLAAICADQSLKEILLGLANEEAKHKLRFELEYDDCILAEN